MKILLVFLLLTPAAAVAQVSADLAAHWTYDKNAPLNFKRLAANEREGILVEDVSYASPVGDRGAMVGPNGGLVAAYLVRPKGNGPFPAVLYGHWCMPGSEQKNRTEFLEEAIVLAHAGVVSLLPDHVRVRPGFVEDTAALSAPQIWTEFQQVVNLRRSADLLMTLPEVDPKRLAYVGHSCNATTGGFLSGLDSRIKAFVLMAGALSDEADSKTKAYQDFREKVGAEKFDVFAASFAWTDVGKYVAKAAPAHLFLQFASDEPFMDEALERQYYAIASEPKKFKIYKAQHALNAEATRDRIAFLSEQLSFRKPDSKLVEGIPVLVQPPWPKE